MKKQMTTEQEKYDKLYNELFEDYVSQGYWEDEADILATRETGIKMGYGCPGLFW